MYLIRSSFVFVNPKSRQITFNYTHALCSRVCTSAVKRDTIIDMKRYFSIFILSSVPFLIVHCQDVMSIVCIMNRDGQKKIKRMYSKKSVNRYIARKKWTKGYYVTISMYTIPFHFYLMCLAAHTVVVIFLSVCTTN